MTIKLQSFAEKITWVQSSDIIFVFFFLFLLLVFFFFFATLFELSKLFMIFQVYLIDFGLAKKYRDKRVRHIPLRQKESCELTGTARYASLNAHKGMELSRRDDLESIGFVLLYFLKGSLPWQGLQARSDQERFKLITEKKLSFSAERLCHKLPDAFKDYLNYCRGLKFEEEPDYEYLRDLFQQLASKVKIELDGRFDWSPNPTKISRTCKNNEQKELE